MATGRPSDRRVGWLAALAGGALALAAQVAAPGGVPLYDGVHIAEPYRYLHPSGDQAGSPTSASSTPTIGDGASPVVVAATGENPPQAQLIAQRGAFELTAGAVSLRVSITPVEGPPPPPGSSISGNVYRFSVTDEAGAPQVIAACDGCISLVLRGPDPHAEASIKRVVNGAWVDVETVRATATGLFQANPTVLGDYAVVEVVAPAPGPDPVLLVGGAVALVLLAGIAYLVFGVRPVPAPPTRAPSAPVRLPSKRKGPRRPPPRRPDR